MADSVAIQHCAQRLAKARDAAQRLEQAAKFTDAESAWSDLLLAASGIYSKLEKASKKDGKTQGWFGRVKHERRTDPLLSYIHHARNSDEHGIEDITSKMDKGTAAFTFREPYDPKRLEGKSFTLGKDAKGHVRFTNYDPDIFEVYEYDKPSLLLVPVKDDRYHDKFPAPTEHLGSQINGKSPLVVAGHAIVYLERLIAEARAVGL